MASLHQAKPFFCPAVFLAPQCLGWDSIWATTAWLCPLRREVEYFSLRCTLCTHHMGLIAFPLKLLPFIAPRPLLQPFPLQIQRCLEGSRPSAQQ